MCPSPWSFQLSSPGFLHVSVHGAETLSSSLSMFPYPWFWNFQTQAVSEIIHSFTLSYSLEDYIVSLSALFGHHSAHFVCTINCVIAVAQLKRGPSAINTGMYFCYKYWAYFSKLINIKYFVAVCVVMHCSRSSHSFAVCLAVQYMMVYRAWLSTISSTLLFTMHCWILWVHYIRYNNSHYTFGQPYKVANSLYSPHSPTLSMCLCPGCLNIQIQSLHVSLSMGLKLTYNM